jgi:N-hydroxyarylamine O-acetyltransferase
MDMDRYLKRINYSGQIALNAETLRDLHQAHLLAVPFENLDIGLKRPIRLDEDALWNKIVTHKRGGFCYELNGLFARLLKQIGFNVTYLNGRVYNRKGGLGIDFDHLALLVTVSGIPMRWLADVGFGDSFTEPLDLDQRSEQAQGLRAYRLEQVHDGYTLWQRNYDGSWERQFHFDLSPRKFPEDYEAGCLYHQTSPDSSFTRERIVSRATPNGRISLEDGRLIVTRGGQRTEQPLHNEVEFHALLQRHFDITLFEEKI